MTHLPYLLIEGMMVAAFVTGAKRGIIIFATSILFRKKSWRRKSATAIEIVFLGRTILGSGLDFDLEIFVSPGGYICGEETGSSWKPLKATVPSRATSHPSCPGRVVAKPTVINNVETFVNVPQILSRGVEWFTAQGVGGARGLKIHWRQRPMLFARAFSKCLWALRCVTSFSPCRWYSWRSRN